MSLPADHVELVATAVRVNHDAATVSLIRDEMFLQRLAPSADT